MIFPANLGGSSCDRSSTKQGPGTSSGRGRQCLSLLVEPQFCSGLSDCPSAVGNARCSAHFCFFQWAVCHHAQLNKRAGCVQNRVLGRHWDQKWEKRERICKELFSFFLLRPRMCYLVRKQDLYLIILFTY